MARPRANIRISLKARGGLTYRIELVRIPFTKRFRIRRNGTKSIRLPDGTGTEAAEEIRRWLANQASNPTTTADILDRPVGTGNLSELPRSMVPIGGHSLRLFASRIAQLWVLP